MEELVVETDPFLALAQKALKGNLHSISELERNLAKDSSEIMKLEAILKSLVPIKLAQKNLSTVENKPKAECLDNAAIGSIDTEQKSILGCALWLQGILSAKEAPIFAKQCIAYAANFECGPAIWSKAALQSSNSFAKMLANPAWIKAIKNGSGLALDMALTKLVSLEKDDMLTSLMDCNNYSILCDRLMEVTKKPLHEMLPVASHGKLLFMMCIMLESQEKLPKETSEILQGIVNNFSNLCYPKLKEATITDDEIYVLYYAGIASNRLSKSEGLWNKFSSIFSSEPKLPKQFQKMILSPYKDKLKTILETDTAIDKSLKDQCSKEIEAIDNLIQSSQKTDGYGWP